MAFKQCNLISKTQKKPSVMWLSVQDKDVIITESCGRIIKIIPDDLAGDGEPLPLLARGDGDRLSFAAGLMEVSR